MSNSVRLGSFGFLHLILCISLPVTSVSFAQNAAARPSVPWPTKGWTKGGFLQTSVSKANSRSQSQPKLSRRFASDTDLTFLDNFRLADQPQLNQPTRRVFDMTL
jgi:hypothetical protein